MQLRELVWRSALRNRAAGDVEVGGSAEPMVFEVTDLVIPSGTNWRDEAPDPLTTNRHVIDTFTAPFSSGYVTTLFFKTDVPDDPDNQVDLAVELLEFYEQAPGSPFMGTNPVGDAMNIGTAGGVGHIAEDWDFAGSPPLPETAHFRVTLGTGGVTTVPITVTARVSFLLM